MIKNCKLSSCNKEFDGTASQQFCSGKCQRRHRYERSKLGSCDETIVQQPITSTTSTTEQEPIRSETQKVKQLSSEISLGSILHDLPPAARFIVATQEKDVKRWEQLWREEKEKRKKAEEETAKLRSELAEVKMDQKLNGIQAENAKPDFLEGLMTNEHMGPVIAGLAQKLIDAMPIGGGQVIPAATMGAVAEVPENLRVQAAQIIDWYAKQDPEVQQLFYKMVNDMAGKEPGENKMRLRFINNMQRYNNNGEAAA